MTAGRLHDRSRDPSRRGDEHRHVRAGGTVDVEAAQHRRALRGLHRCRRPIGHEFGKRSFGACVGSEVQNHHSDSVLRARCAMSLTASYSGVASVAAGSEVAVRVQSPHEHVSHASRGQVERVDGVRIKIRSPRERSGGVPAEIVPHERVVKLVGFRPACSRVLKLPFCTSLVSGSSSAVRVIRSSSCRSSEVPCSFVIFEPRLLEREQVCPRRTPPTTNLRRTI